jgi:hypothetical protein
VIFGKIQQRRRIYLPTIPQAPTCRSGLCLQPGFYPSALHLLPALFFLIQNNRSINKSCRSKNAGRKKGEKLPFSSCCIAFLAQKP